jgi:hypothetical protein
MFIIDIINIYLLCFVVAGGVVIARGIVFAGGIAGGHELQQKRFIAYCKICS